MNLEAATLFAAASTLLAAASAVILSGRCRRLQRHAQRVSRHRAAVALARRRSRLTELSPLERYLSNIRIATAPVLVTMPSGTILAASRATVELFGYDSEAELTRVPIARLYSNPADRARTLKDPLRENGEIRSGEFRMLRRDGSEIRVLSNARVRQLEDGVSCYEGYLIDITELREAVEQRQRLESQLHLARKLEVIGQLASGIAHEINTPMQFIGDNIAFLKTAFDRLAARLSAGPVQSAAARQSSDRDMKRLLQDVLEAFDGTFEGVQRVTETVRAMKEFAHPGDLEMSSTDLNQVLRTTLIVARNEYKHAADVTVDFGDVPAVDCRRAEINKIFLNLIVNAAHAIEAAGRSDRGVITIRTLVEPAHVRVDVEDSGCGISPAVLPRIFDPFFTTKAVGKGSGQGLSIVRSVVKSHGGEVTVASEVGKGTTFTIRLPRPPVSQSVSTPASGAAPDVEALIG